MYVYFVTVTYRVPLTRNKHNVYKIVCQIPVRCPVSEFQGNCPWNLACLGMLSEFHGSIDTCDTRVSIVSVY